MSIVRDGSGYFNFVFEFFITTYVVETLLNFPPLSIVFLQLSFLSKLNLNENNLNFVYNGKGGEQFDKTLTFNLMANTCDKTRKKMNIY